LAAWNWGRAEVPLAVIAVELLDFTLPRGTDAGLDANVAALATRSKLVVLGRWCEEPGSRWL